MKFQMNPKFMNLKSKLFASAVAFTMVLGVATPMFASAQTTAELTAQINMLLSQIAQLQARVSGGSTAVTTVTFGTNLTIGSKGADVTALQTWLVNKGVLVMPNGVAYGYFGSLTKSALAKYQLSVGIAPAVGYFGPMTRAKINAQSVTTTTTTTTSTTAGCVAGAAFSSTTGAACATTTTSTGTTGITTPGVEGTLSVTAGPISNTVLNVGQTMVPVLSVRAQAQTSDISIQRITVDLGSNTNIYNKLFSKLYVVDSSNNVLASVNLNSSTVVQSGTDYIVALTGFNVVVPKNTYKDITLKADLYSSIDSKYLSTGTNPIVPVFMIQSNGVRGVDGAGIDQYGPSSNISQTLTINGSLTDNAQANVSLAAATPITASVPVLDTTNGQYLQLPVLAFNVNAQNDALHLRQVVVNFVGVRTNNTTATATAAYLYNGSTQVSSASINPTTGVAVFSNITNGTNGATIPAGTTVVYTVKADVTGVTAGSLALSASLNTTVGQTMIYNSQDSTITNSGSAVGLVQTVLGKGPAVTLASTNIVKTTVSNNTTSTSTLTATFNVNLQAVGSDLLFGTQASTSPTFVFGIYKDGVLLATNVASTSNFSLPTGVTQDATQSFTVSQNQTVSLPVTFSFQSNAPAGTALPFGSYAVSLEKVNYVSAGVAGNISTVGQTAWRTGTQVLP